MKIFRCPVHDVINLDMGNPIINNLITDLIDSPEFQRLRRIKQLGLADFAYPNATHSRFAHSLGVAYLAKRMITQILSLQDKLENRNNPQITAFFKEIRRDAPFTVIAALLHDIGHSILSHVTESILGTHHEEWTRRIILEDTNINRLLTHYNPQAPEIVCHILASFPTHGHSGRIIDSTIDVDKMDYLLRDSHMTGSGYGRFDLEWLLNILTVGIYNGRVVVGLDEGKGLSVAEDFIMARIYMLKNVYLHKTNLIAQKMLELLFKRLSEVDINPYPTKAMEAVFKGKATLADFLSISDEHLQILLSILTKSQDKILNKLANGLYNRKLYKEITEEEFCNSNPYNAFQTNTSLMGDKMKYQAGKDEIFLFNKKGHGRELLELSSIAQLSGNTRNIFAGLI